MYWRQKGKVEASHLVHQDPSMLCSSHYGHRVLVHLVANVFSYFRKGIMPPLASCSLPGRRVPSEKEPMLKEKKIILEKQILIADMVEKGGNYENGKAGYPESMTFNYLF